ncbi:MipA/OmpV family protein [Ruegeria sp. SCPT10]|uniref:MipA/OmpV family protein n=1 Tax=Ruegeria sp. SCP10 TaxID=3141377 RepID=UPI003339BB36
MTLNSCSCGRFAAIGFGVVLSSTPLSAQVANTLSASDKDWAFYIGAGGGLVPEYQGSDEYELAPLVTFEGVWRDRFVISDQGLGAFLYDQNGFRVSAAVGYGGGRDEDDSDDLKGLGDIDNSAVLSLGTQFDLGQSLTATADVRKFLGGSEGTVVSLGLQTQVPFGVIRGALAPTGRPYNDETSQNGVVLIGGVSVDWADEDYNQSFFGVTSTQSARSGLRQYRAESGVNALNVELGVSKQIGRSWGVTGLLAYSRLLGDAADSPIVKSKGNYAAVVSVAYQF